MKDFALPRPTGLSCGRKTGSDPTFFDRMAAAGITHAELCFSSPNPKDQPDWQALKALADRAGVTVWSLHLPFMPFKELDLSSPDEALRQKTVAVLSEVMRCAGKIGVPRYVVHPSAEPIPDEDFPCHMAQAKKSLAALANVAAEVGATLCVENLPRTNLSRNSDALLELLEADPRLRVCFDTNHLLKQPARDFVAAVGDKIETIHVSDYDIVDEKHWMPGEGDVDWVEMMDLLDGIGYQGPFLYEIGVGPGSTPKTIVRERDLTFADLVRNHEELEARKPLTVFGKRNGVKF